MSRMLRAGFPGLLVLFGFLFARPAEAKRMDPLYEPKNAPVMAGKEVTAEQVKQAFFKVAGQIQGWSFEAKGEDRLIGTLQVRTHKVVVEIPYSAKEYSILYVESENMLYDPETRTIHNKYDNWIKNLEKYFTQNLTSG